MNFFEIAQNRQSCRNYDAGKAVEQEKLDKILETARLAPSACNGQPYLITVCKGDAAKEVAKATTGMGMNKFAADVDAAESFDADKRCVEIIDYLKGKASQVVFKLTKPMAKERAIVDFPTPPFPAQTAKILGVDTPKVACISASEQVLPSVISSTEGAILAKMGDRGQLGKVIVDGTVADGVISGGTEMTWEEVKTNYLN